MVGSQIVTYSLDDDTTVMFEMEPLDEFTLAGARDVVGRVRLALGPAVAAAAEVLDQVRVLSPTGVEVKFGVKVSGTMNWIVAKAATEGNFEVTLSWQPGQQPAESREAGPAPTDHE